MLRINTTVDNIQTKDNIIKDKTPPHSDYFVPKRYPSAKSLRDTYEQLQNDIRCVHPIGSILCMNTNRNPSTLVGGEWELVSKKFKHTWITLSSSDWTATNAAFYSGNIALYGDIMMLRFACTPNAVLNDTTRVLGTIKLSNYGLSPMFNGTSKGKAQSDGGDSTIVYTLSATGELTVLDSLYYPGKTHSQATSGQSMYIQNYTHMHVANMPDNYCDRFYFKRVG